MYSKYSLLLFFLKSAKNSKNDVHYDNAKSQSYRLVSINTQAPILFILYQEQTGNIKLHAFIVPRQVIMTL